MTTINLNFEARPPFVPYLKRKERWTAIVAHRRAGKTVACIMDLVKRAIEHKGREPRFAYIAPTYTQAKDVAWSYLKEYTQVIPGVEKSESELTVTFPHNKARIRLYGAENYDRLRGLYLDGAILDEFGDVDPRAWAEVVRPALSDRKGWATFIGTPKGRNEFFNIVTRASKAEDWYFSELRASKTKLIDAEELEDAKRSMTPEQFAQEYECSFDAAVRGAYYGKEISEAESEGRITKVPYDKAADVYASWDLGIGDSTAIWVFQIVGQEWHFLNHYEASGADLGHYVDWIKALPFTVNEHILPHDAKARELQTGDSRVEFLEARGLKCRVIERHGWEDRVAKARMKFNRMWFDEANCERGIDCLRMYRSDYDEKNQVLKPRPLHDWASHSADAFGYGVVGANDSRTAPILEMDTEWVV